MHFISYRLDTLLGPYDARIPREMEYARALVARRLPAQAAEVLERLTRSRYLANGERAVAALLLGDLYRDELAQPDRARACYLMVTFLSPDSHEDREARRRLGDGPRAGP